MGKSAPEQPAPPDPNVVSQAQTTSNRETAIANANLNRINQVTPYGNLTYTTNGTNEDGTPRYTSTTTLSPDQQALFDSSNSISQGLANLGQRQIENVNSSITKPLDFSGLPQINQGQLQASAGAVPELQSFIPGIGDVRAGIDSSGVGKYQNSANYGHIQDDLDTSNVPALVGGADLLKTFKDAQDAAYNLQTSRLDPQWKDQQDNLTNQLVQQGVLQNSDAWNKAVESQGRQKTDAYQTALNNSIGLGNAAQAQLYGQGLSSNQNAFGQAQAKGNFHNAAQQQGFGQALENANLNNNVTNSQFAKAQAEFNALNQAQQQTFNQMQDRTNLANNVASNRFGMGLANANLNNQAAGQGYAQSTGARNQAINELLQKQQNPLNVLNQLRTGAQGTSPTFGNVPLTNMAGTDVQSPINNAYNAQVANRNASIQQGNNTMSGLFGLGAAALGAPTGTFSALTSLFSDIRLKENIQLIGKTNGGLPIYTYQYKGSKVAQMGVMAQDVEKVIPDAVIEHSSGYKMVDYSKVK